MPSPLRSVSGQPHRGTGPRDAAPSFERFFEAESRRLFGALAVIAGTAPRPRRSFRCVPKALGALGSGLGHGVADAGWDHDTAPQAVSAQGYPMGHWNYDVWSAKRSEISICGTGPPLLLVQLREDPPGRDRPWSSQGLSPGARPKAKPGRSGDHQVQAWRRPLAERVPRRGRPREAIAIAYIGAARFSSAGSCWPPRSRTSEQASSRWWVSQTSWCVKQ